MKRALVWFAFLSFVACNAPSRVGAPCTANSDCDLGQSCNTTAPGGFCTHGCTFDGAQLTECPSGSVCTTLTPTSQVCSPICTGAAGCRDQYECNGVTGSSLKACKVKI